MATYYYARVLAAIYAEKWALQPNPDWFDDHQLGTDSQGNDCTNFVSQALYAGGLPMVFAPMGIELQPFDNRCWYSAHGPDLGRRTLKRSWSWSNADNFYWHLKTSGRAVEARKDEIAIGDIVQIRLPKKRVVHSTIVTSFRQIAPRRQDLFVSYHSNDTRNLPLNEFLSRFSEGIPIFWRMLDTGVDLQPYFDSLQSGISPMIPGPPT